MTLKIEIMENQRTDINYKNQTTQMSIPVIINTEIIVIQNQGIIRKRKGILRQ